MRDWRNPATDINTRIYDKYREDALAFCDKAENAGKSYCDTDEFKLFRDTTVKLNSLELQVRVLASVVDRLKKDNKRLNAELDKYFP